MRAAGFVKERIPRKLNVNLTEFVSVFSKIELISVFSENLLCDFSGTESFS